MFSYSFAVLKWRKQQEYDINIASGDAMLKTSLWHYLDNMTACHAEIFVLRKAIKQVQLSTTLLFYLFSLLWLP